MSGDGPREARDWRCGMDGEKSCDVSRWRWQRCSDAYGAAMLTLEEIN
jgi:hypothetical protein